MKTNKPKCKCYYCSRGMYNECSKSHVLSDDGLNQDKQEKGRPLPSENVCSAVTHRQLKDDPPALSIKTSDWNFTSKNGNKYTIRRYKDGVTFFINDMTNNPDWSMPNGFTNTEIKQIVEFITNQKFIPLEEHERLVWEANQQGHINQLNNQKPLIAMAENTIKEDFNKRVEEFRKRFCLCVIRRIKRCDFCRDIDEILLRK